MTSQMKNTAEVNLFKVLNTLKFWYLNSLRLSCYRHKIDAVAISFFIWQIMAQMCAVNTYNLPVLQTSYILPINFFISKAWPSMIFTFDYKITQTPANWRPEQTFSRHRVVVCSNCFGSIFLSLFRKFFLPCNLGSKSITTVFCVVPVEATYSVSSVIITSPFQIILNWFITCAVVSFLHNRFRSNYWQLLIVWNSSGCYWNKRWYFVCTSLDCVRTKYDKFLRVRSSWTNKPSDNARVNFLTKC